MDSSNMDQLSLKVGFVKVYLKGERSRRLLHSKCFSKCFRWIAIALTIILRCVWPLWDFSFNISCWCLMFLKFPPSCLVRITWESLCSHAGSPPTLPPLSLTLSPTIGYHLLPPSLTSSLRAQQVLKFWYLFHWFLLENSKKETRQSSEDAVAG